jgi:uncharacterized protein (DUF1697 family)
MPKYIAFLRAINVGGHTVKMEDLRELFRSLGFTGVETVLASGNVIFETRARTPSGLERKIEACLEEALGYEVATFLRTDSEVAAVAASRPFGDPELQSAVALNVGFLSQAPDRASLRVIHGWRTAIDDFQVHGREVFWLCRVKQSESTFSGAALERALGLRATFRGMKTIQRLAARCPPVCNLGVGDPVPGKARRLGARVGGPGRRVPRGARDGG